MTVITNQDIQPMPEWFTELRDHQTTAIAQIMEAFETADVVFLDAPTGTGKTLIGEMVRRAMGARTLYVCSDKSLQAQFMKDYPYARMLQGRRNYPTQHMGEAVTCDDCTGAGNMMSCLFCDSAATCPYLVAKRRAAASDLAVLNTAYLLTEGNGQSSTFGGKNRRELVIIDEADVLEGALMGYVEYEVPQWIGRELKLQWPRKASHKPTLVKWLKDAGRAAGDWCKKHEETPDVKKLRGMEQFATETVRVEFELARDIELAADEDQDSRVDEDQTGRWLRDYDTKTFRLRPVMVSGYGTRYLWRHGKKFLIMSATIISAEEMAESLGLGLEWAEVTVPMTFAVENRPIVIAPVASMTYKTMQEPGTIEAMATAIVKIGERHAGERVLVHTASYKLTDRLIEAVHAQGGMQTHNIYAYGSSSEKAGALERYLDDENGVLFAASMSRGVDLKGDACRVQVIAKVPFPSLADKQTSARMRLPGGQLWYDVQTVRDIVQMTGRGVRSESDHATTYILDGQFGRIWSKSKRLLPAWWREAVDQTQSMSWLT